MSEYEQPPTLTDMLGAVLEPEADYAESRNGPYVTALTSIAISLKRIADQLDGSGLSGRDNTSVADVLNALPYLLNKRGTSKPTAP